MVPGRIHPCRDSSEVGIEVLLSDVASRVVRTVKVNHMEVILWVSAPVWGQHFFCAFWENETLAWTGKWIWIFCENKLKSVQLKVTPRDRRNESVPAFSENFSEKLIHTTAVEVLGVRPHQEESDSHILLNLLTLKIRLVSIQSNPPPPTSPEYGPWSASDGGPGADLSTAPGYLEQARAIPFPSLLAHAVLNQAGMYFAYDVPGSLLQDLYAPPDHHPAPIIPGPPAQMSSAPVGAPAPMLPSTAEVPPGVPPGTGAGAAATNLPGMNLPTGGPSAGQNNAASIINGARSASSSFIAQSQGGVVGDVVQPGAGATAVGPSGGTNGVSYLRDPTSPGSYAAFAAAAATLNESAAGPTEAQIFAGATQAQPMGGTVGAIVGTTTSVGTNNMGIFCRRLSVGILDLYIYYIDPRTRCTKIDSIFVHRVRGSMVL